jgi:hypothetical protein
MAAFHFWFAATIFAFQSRFSAAGKELGCAID